MLYELVQPSAWWSLSLLSALVAIEYIEVVLLKEPQPLDSQSMEGLLAKKSVLSTLRLSLLSVWTLSFLILSISFIFLRSHLLS